MTLFFIVLPVCKVNLFPTFIETTDPRGKLKAQCFTLNNIELTVYLLYPWKHLIKSSNLSIGDVRRLKGAREGGRVHKLPGAVGHGTQSFPIKSTLFLHSLPQIPLFECFQQKSNFPSNEAC